MTNPYYGYPQGAPWGPSPPPPPPYGPPPPGRWIPPGSGWGPPASAMPRRRTRGWLLATVALFLMTVTAAGAIIAYQHHKNSDPSKIKVLLSVFSETVSQGDPQKIARFICREESEPYLDSVAAPQGDVANPQKPMFKVGGVVVHGNAASATLIFQNNQTQTMYFRKEDGKWTVCAPAKDQL